MTLLDDWLKYVEDPSLFDKHHFESLMLELETHDQLEAAFAHLPGGREFIRRVEQFRHDANFNGTYLFPTAQKADETAFKLAEQYRDHIADRLSELGDPDAKLIRNQPVVTIAADVYKARHRAGTLPLLDATMTIGDDVIDFTIDERPAWVRGLREAVYMMTTIPEVTRYLLSPILKYPLDDEPAAKLWLMVHRVDFTKENTLLIVENTE